MSNSDKLAAILKMADPQSNSSYQERKVALNKAHKLMDDTGMSYASVGMSQADAERIETQFCVSVNIKPKSPPKEKRVSIFSRSGEIAASDHPHYTSQPTPSKKPVVKITDWEAEYERKQRDEADKRYANWQQWRDAEDVRQAQSDIDATRFFKKFLLGLALVIAISAFVVFSQNAALIGTAILAVKIFGVIFVSLMAIFVIAISR